MAKKDVSIKIGSYKGGLGAFKKFELNIGKVRGDDWEEPMGPTPFPTVSDLRDWDFKLLYRYKPLYMPLCDLCCLCTYGKCDLSRDQRGACGIDLKGQQSRIVLLAACIGACTHSAHARHLVSHLIDKYGFETPIYLGEGVKIEMPHARCVCGIRPKTLGDLQEILDYVERQLTQMVAVTHIGQEGSNIDFESKVFHVGMLDHVGMEVADVAQMIVFNFPLADPNAPLADLGFSSIDQTKPVILVIGHNVPPSVEIIDYLTRQNQLDQVEVCGICCTAHDLTRYTRTAKIIGPISQQLRFIQSGVPDVIVVDEQCIRVDAVQQAMAIHAPVIATTEKSCMELPNRTEDPVDEIVDDLVSGKVSGALILDEEKVGEVASRVALAIAPKRKKFKVLPNKKELQELASECCNCLQCVRVCHQDNELPGALAEAAKGNFQKLAGIYEGCIGCNKCSDVCPRGIPVYSLVAGAAELLLKNEKYKIRVGRGAIQDTEIRNVGRPIVLGEIPGIIAFVGCANYPHGGRDVAEMADEFAQRRYIITVSGCAAMSAGLFRDEQGENVFEKYTGEFDAGCVSNVGSCVANAHITGAAMKIANIFAKRPLRGNYEEIADYIYNRVGAVAIAWGAMSQKAASIAAGCWRLGIPVIVGPRGSKYRRMLLGRKDKEEDWYSLDARTGERVYIGPVPEHLFYAAETKEEAMVTAAKLVMRPNDTSKGRMIKLTHYIDLSKRLYGVLPDDIHLFVRRETDIPVTFKEEIVKALQKAGWKEQRIPDPTLLSRMIHGSQKE
ncbi:MAG: CO dehydrogenase/acetyl-CoA synthase complex subunit alpha [Candidatus Ranarchaeia archaeon]